MKGSNKEAGGQPDGQDPGSDLGGGRLSLLYPTVQSPPQIQPAVRGGQRQEEPVPLLQAQEVLPGRHEEGR